MSEPENDALDSPGSPATEGEPSTPLPGGRAMALLAGALLVGFGLLATLAAVDRHQRATLERVEAAQP